MLRLQSTALGPPGSTTLIRIGNDRATNEPSAVCSGDESRSQLDLIGADDRTKPHFEGNLAALSR